jgi:hypothetical protein
MKCELIQLANYKISMFAHVMMFGKWIQKKFLKVGVIALVMMFGNWNYAFWMEGRRNR